MTSWTRFGRPRASAALAAAGLAVAGLALAGVASTPASAADASTKYLTIFREATPTAIASGTASRYGVTPASVFWFDAWGTGSPFNVSEAKALWSQGILPHYTWEPWNTSLSLTDPNQIDLQDIIDGRWDTYIRARGAEFASAGVPIMVRWGHEFNGNWYPWGIANNGGDPSRYINAYRRVHDLVVAAGATNVQWIWAFNNGPTPDVAYNDPARSYPGDAYVDWVGIDGYNWGLAPSWDPAGNYWSSFDSMFSSSYAKARAIAPRRPVMVSEFASSEDGGNKAQWINDMSAALQSGRYPDLKTVAYFDQNKEELWAGDSSSSVLTAFTSWVRQPYMRGTGTELAQVAGQYKGTTTTSTTTTTRSTSSTTTRSTSSTTTRSTSSTTTRSTSSTTSGTTTTGGACTATYRVVNSWPGGYQADITVRAGASPLSRWTLRWTLGQGESISQLWSGTLAVSGTSVTVTNAPWNGSLGAGGSTTLGLIGSMSGTAPAVPPLTCTAG